MIRLSLSAFLIAALAVVGGRSALAAQGYVPDYLSMEVLHDFGPNEPGGPVAGLIFDKAGNLYGTEAGIYFSSPGAVFELSPPPPGAPYIGWKETVLHTFNGGSDGLYPGGPVVMDTAGNLYGTTGAGGAAPGCTRSFGCGIVYELSPPAAGQKAWTETILYRFTEGADGGAPLSGLIFDAAGNLFGTTAQGDGRGTVFELSPPSAGQTAWSFQVLYTGFSDNLQGSVVMDASGQHLYGATHSSAFSLTRPASGNTSWTETDIASFGGYFSVTGMIFDGSGNLYGTTNSPGTVFELSPPAKGTKWDLSFLAIFSNSTGNGPSSNLVFDSAGNIYGNNVGGAHSGFGTVFRLAPDGTITVFHKFDNGRDGYNPEGAVVLDATGNIYGTSSAGGPNHNGSVWRLIAR
jgi:uncharacterized repeat protein (TIGR03803 family)